MIPEEAAGITLAAWGGNACLPLLPRFAGISKTKGVLLCVKC